MTSSDQNRPRGGESAADAQLDQLFAEARRSPPEMPDSLAARMLADAYDAQPLPAAEPAAQPAQVRGPGVLPAVFRFLGGWSVATALVMACALGLSVGYAGPDLVPGMFEDAWVETGVDGEADPFETLLSELGS